jgi:hypothetical protein
MSAGYNTALVHAVAERGIVRVSRASGRVETLDPLEYEVLTRAVLSGSWWQTIKMKWRLR